MSKTFPDPFAIKHLGKLHPARLVFTAKARLDDWLSKRHFETYQIPIRLSPLSQSAARISYNQAETAVTLDQMNALLVAICATNGSDAPIVEVGAFRGVSTEILAKATTRRVYAIDPYAGYGGAESDYDIFSKRTIGLPNISHLRSTSGEAAESPDLTSISFAFVDAVHDYVNARFDGTTWLRKLVPGGMIAFHDTDSRVFPGVMRAVWEILNDRANTLTLFIHVPGLVILQRQ